ncbi:MAG TPA: valine--tRNA ligase [Acidimicrobiia bacterium]|nr:valine--tRNA ligase [Acidimicrobiia bacterium]
MTRVPEKPSLDGLEARWSERWDADGVYRFDRTNSRDEIYSVDTPPPTVSGSLHMGSVFGYAQTDSIVRYRRMRGDDVFYPMGWDDNGLATERRVQNYYGVRCDPSLAYDPDFTPPEKPGKDAVPVSRPNFVELCERLTEIDEQAFEAMWRRLGLSVDWSLIYTTIGEGAQRVSQRAFLRNLARGEAYQAEAPTLWDVDDRTAVAQAELEDREQPGATHRVRFGGIDGGADVVIETTRPELIPACVALVAHPDDARYRDRFGGEVTTPLFGVRVPVVAHRLAEPEKGTGIAMICTFGDVTDVVWWRELRLPTRSVMGRDGRLVLEPPAWDATDPDAGARYRELGGKTVKQARARVVELLHDAGRLEGEPQPITHPVKFYERGSRPLEIVTTRQWYIRNGAHDSQLRDALLAQGRELQWHPPHMRARFESWVEGLNTDWLISRQRFFGVPFPVWYPIDDDGEVDYEQPLLAREEGLPVDPSNDVPDGYDDDQRGKPGGFVGDPDIMDTWATSSLTPQIGTRWEDDPDLFSRTFPTNLRPQGGDIIRTWLFATLLRSHYEHGTLPWSDTTINGWILDPDRKKMSKSKGNVVTPVEYFDRFGSDAVRYWAQNGRPGVDTAVDEGQIKVGRRLAIKILNASKFALGVIGEGGAGEVTEPLDRSMLRSLTDIVEEATGAFEGYDYSRALERTERFFWGFCDDYVELVKQRAYGAGEQRGAASARRALELALSTLLRLFAPHLPFVTEEVWSWWQDGSIHQASWPDPEPLRAETGDAERLTYRIAADVLGEIRKAKTSRQKSLRAEVELAVVRDTVERLQALEPALEDVQQAGRVRRAFELLQADEFAVEVELAEDAA